MKASLRDWVVAVAVLAAFQGRPAAAQMASFGSTDGGPIEVQADNGIEWQQAGQIFVARGNAVATRGTTRINAAVLRAHYREKKGGGTEIWRLEGENDVVITTPSEKAYGDQVVYDVDQAVVVLKGPKGARLETPGDTVTAHQQIEYWQEKRMAVARGNAQVVHKDKGKEQKLRASVLTALFQEDRSGKTEVYRVDAFDNVQIQTDTETVTADKGVYKVESGIATLTGSVKIRRGPNELNGCSADVNLRTGISRLHGCGKGTGGGGGRVSGTLVPTQKTNR